MLAAPDVPIFKNSSIVTGLGMHSFVKSISMYVDVKSSVHCRCGFDSESVLQCNMLFVHNEDSCIFVHTAFLSEQFEHLRSMMEK